MRAVPADKLAQPAQVIAFALRRPVTILRCIFDEIVGRGLAPAAGTHLNYGAGASPCPTLFVELLRR